MERRIGVRGIAFKHGKVLSVQHKDNQGKPMDFWAIPGGGLDSGELLLDGITREMIEETGITPQIGRLLFVQQFINHTKQREEMEFFFHITNPDDYETIDLSATSHGEQELAAIEWKTPADIALLPAFLQTYDIAAHIDAQQPVFFYSDMAS